VRESEVETTTANFDPDDYLKPLDIIKRKMKESGGTTYHYAIYLGNGKVANISVSDKDDKTFKDSFNIKGRFGAKIDTWEHFLKGETKVEIYHPFIPFKRPELILEHIDIAIKAKYG